MSENLHISIAMCTYNGSRFIQEQLASIATQTRLPDELVICDDGSTDSTPEIVAEFARTFDFPVRFVRNPRNLGSTKNFDQAITLCAGDLIALCDQDDIWKPEKLARQAEIMERDPQLGGVFSDAELIDDASQPIGRRLWAGIGFRPREQSQFLSGQSARVLLRKNVVTGATLMMRASLRTFFLPIPGVWVHDGWIAWMLTIRSRLALIKDPLVLYRLHSNQQIGVEAMAMAQQFSLMERMRKGKLEEPAKQIACAREMEELREVVALWDQREARTLLPQIQQKIAFHIVRGSPPANRLLRVLRVFRHARDYYRYESGSKCFVRDVVIALI